MSNDWEMFEEAQEIVRQGLNNALRERPGPIPAATEPPLPLIQPTPQEHLFQQQLVEREIVGPQRPVAMIMWGNDQNEMNIL
jgi:hypothetical protein